MFVNEVKTWSRHEFCINMFDCMVCHTCTCRYACKSCKMPIDAERIKQTFFDDWANLL